MRSFARGCAGILLFLPLGLLFWLNMGIAGSPLSQLAERAVCQSGEELVEFPSGSGSLPWSYYCQNTDGSRLDQTFSVYALFILVGGGAALVAVLVALALWMSGQGQQNTADSPAKEFNMGWSEPAIKTQSMTIISLDGQPVNPEDLSPEQAQQIDAAMATLKNLGSLFPQEPLGFRGEDLPARLTQLQQALDQGLISQAEYDRIRQGILDKADD